MRVAQGGAHRLQTAFGQAIGGLRKIGAADRKSHVFHAGGRCKHGIGVFGQCMLAGTGSHLPGGTFLSRFRLGTAVLLHPVGQGAVIIVAAQRRIATGGQYLEHAFFHAQNGNVEGAAAKVEYRVNSFAAIVQSVGQCCSRRFIDQPQHGQSSQLRGVLGRLALRIVKIGRNGDDRAIDKAAQTVFCPLAQRRQNAGTDLYGGLVAGTRVNVHHALLRIFSRQIIRQPPTQAALDITQAAPHQPLDRHNGIGGIDGLPLQGGFTDQHAPIRCVMHGRRQDHPPLLVRQALRQAVANSRHERMRRAQINTDADAALVRVRTGSGFGNM